MQSKLKLALILFFIFLLGFIVIVFVSEYKNMKNLKSEYPDLTEEVYEYRKDSLKIWAIGLILKFLIPLLFLTSRLSYRIRYFAENDKSLFMTGLLYGIIFFTLML